MNLYVMRHGQTNCNVERRYNCRLDEDINAKGIEQAEIAREKIKDLDIDLIICSPMLRTRHTCEIINVNNIPVIYDDRLIEREGGILTGKSTDEYYYKEYYNYYSTNVVEGLETLHDVFKRVNSLIDDIKINYKDKNILLITHKVITVAIPFYFKNIPEDGMVLNACDQKNCEIKKYVLN